jgi:hypothetical protein
MDIFTQTYPDFVDYECEIVNETTVEEAIAYGERLLRLDWNKKQQFLTEPPSAAREE